MNVRIKLSLLYVVAMFMLYFIASEAALGETKHAGKEVLAREFLKDWEEISNKDGNSKLVSKAYPFRNLYCEKTILTFEFNQNQVMKESLEFERRYAVLTKGKSCSDKVGLDFFRIQASGSPGTLLNFYTSAEHPKNFESRIGNSNIFDIKHKNQIATCFLKNKANRKIVFGRSYFGDKDTNEYFEIFLDGCFEKESPYFLVVTGDDLSSTIKYSVRYKTLTEVTR